MSNSDDAKTDRTTFEVMFEPLAAFLEQHERDHPPHHREQLSFKKFVRTLVYHFTENCESGRQLLTDVSTTEPELELGEVKRSTFFDAFQRFPVVWFASMLSYLLATVVSVYPIFGAERASTPVNRRRGSRLCCKFGYTESGKLFPNWMGWASCTV